MDFQLDPSLSKTRLGELRKGLLHFALTGKKQGGSEIRSRRLDVVCLLVVFEKVVLNIVLSCK